MDKLTYNYNLDSKGRLANNKLRHVNEDPTILASAYNEDIDNQGADNYQYDNIGNLIKDNAENLQRINWTVYGKIASISKLTGGIAYGYDAGGQRIKKTFDRGGTAGSITTYYVRDAQGNTMGVYSNDQPGGAQTYAWQEQHLYGSSRLGMVTPNLSIPGGQPLGNDSYLATNDPIANGIAGKRLYELSNHLGNVLATISDKKIPVANGATIDHYEADLVAANDYYPFGMQMPGRKYSQANSSYRYGFNGKENDNDVKGEGNQQDYGMRIYDPRVGRFLSVDPISKNYPELTPYQFASNKPINSIDLDGLECWELSTPLHNLDQRLQVRQQQLKTAVLIVARDNTLHLIKPKEQEIIMADIYGVGHIGPKSVVESNVAAIRRNYYDAVGENIRGGLFGAVGYHIGGDRGSFVGASFDGIVFSFGGIPNTNSSVLSKPNRAATEAYIPFTNKPAFGRSYNVKNSVMIGAFSNFKNIEELAPQFIGRNLENATNDLLGNGWEKSSGNWGSKTVFEKNVGREKFYAMWEPANMEHSTDGMPTSYWKITKDKISQTNESKVRRIPLSTNFKH